MTELNLQLDNDASDLIDLSELIDINFEEDMYLSRNLINYLYNDSDLSTETFNMQHEIKTEPVSPMENYCNDDDVILNNAFLNDIKPPTTIIQQEQPAETLRKRRRSNLSLNLNDVSVNDYVYYPYPGVCPTKTNTEQFPKYENNNNNNTYSNPMKNSTDNFTNKRQRVLSNSDFYVRSPDSGYSCTSPINSGDEFDSTADKKVNPFGHLMPNSPFYKEDTREELIEKIADDEDKSGYNFILCAPISTGRKLHEDRLTYINKATSYKIVLENQKINSACTKSVVCLIFRQNFNCDLNEIEAWKFWHSKQNSVTAKIIEVAAITKNVFVEPLASNAFQVNWNGENIVELQIIVHCLSTDFSYQKGIKGLPLHLQVDTYSNTDRKYPFRGDNFDFQPPQHRAYCQVKLFSEKGAERKARDELKRQNNGKTLKVAAARKNGNDQQLRYHEECTFTKFYRMKNVDGMPALFDPVFCKYEDGLENKRIIYVKERTEAVFTAVQFTDNVTSLKYGLEKKFPFTQYKINNIYRRSLKGIVAILDDDLLNSYENESTFTISFIKKSDSVTVENDSSDFCYNVTLTEIIVTGDE